MTEADPLPPESDPLPPESEPVRPGQQVNDLKAFLLILGVLQILLGLAALSFPMFATFASITFFGWLILLGGVTEAVNCFLSLHKTRVMLGAISAVLGIVAGLFIILHPVAAAVELTLIVAIFLIVGGLYRFLATSTLPIPFGSWARLSGVVSFILGIMVWRRWPNDSVWFIGICVGIDLVFYGVWWVMLALSPPLMEVESGELYKYE